MDTTNHNSEYPPVITASAEYLKESRVINITNLFEAKFNRLPEFYVRAPGRVNLIGEHIDYCGYSVCPMAIQQDILLAVSSAVDGKLHLINEDSSYPEFECDILSFSIKSDKGKPPAWHDYFLCGLKGILETLPSDKSPSGINVVVTGNIPPGSGLSSSSALVCAAALAATQANKILLPKTELAALCASSERYIGTQGGGMDQAISFLGTKGSAKHVRFNPVSAEDVKLPEGAVFVVAHSTCVVNKAATAHYNCRVVECRLAAQMIAKKSGLPWREMRKLRDVQEALGVELPQMSAVVKKLLHENPYTKQEVCEELDVSEDELNEASLSQNTLHIGQFKLYQRALHVFQEAARVLEFCSTCAAGGSATVALRRLGQLMGDSHESLRLLYECSHPLLDCLVELGAGACLGARLTGAGWGGCSVALVTRDSCNYYVEMLKKHFYDARARNRDVDSLLFVTEPGAGAAVYVV